MIEDRRGRGWWVALVVALGVSLAGALGVTPFALEFAVTQSLRNLAEAQSESLRTSGRYFNALPSEFIGASTVLWPVEAKVLATCTDGYVMSAAIDGTNRYVSSTSPSSVVSSTDELELPACVDPRLVGASVPVPGAVSELAATRYELDGDELGEAMRVTWAPVEMCPASEATDYQVAIANSSAHAQSLALANTKSTTHISSDIWNGSSYAVTVRARCGAFGDWGPDKTLEFSQTLPTPKPPAVSSSETGRITIAVEPVSSSPLTAYMVEYRREQSDEWLPLMPYLKSTEFDLFPATYEFEEGDHSRIQALADSGAASPWSSDAEVQQVP